MARTVEDAALMLDVLAGPDDRDPQSLTLPHQLRFTDAIKSSLPPLRAAYSPRLGLGFSVDPDIAAGVRNAVERLSAAGLHIEEADPVWPEGAGEAGLSALQFAGLAALYGERWQREPALFDPDIGAQIEAGLALTGADVARALHLREAAYRALAAFFQRYDVLLTPTTPVTAWPLDQLGPPTIEGRPASPRGHAVFTPLFNHCYVPACSVPCGTNGQGLPIGLQIVGRRQADALVLRIAALAETQKGQWARRIL